MATRKAITLVSGLFQEVNTPTDKLDFAGNTTADLSENTNLYFTNSRARAAVSVTDAGGLGSLAYNSSTGVITYTGPSNSDIRGLFSIASGSGLTYNSSTGEFGTNAIPNSQLANDDITIGSTAVALGASQGTFTGLTSLASTTLISGVADAANSIKLASGNIIFEGSTADGNETTLTVTDPTSDRTITFPDNTGVVLTTGSSIQNSNLANSSFLIGSTTVSLGGGATQFHGFSSIQSTKIVSGSGSLDSANSITLESGNITFEGSTADGNEIILTAADASGSDKTITLPNATGTVALLSTLSIASGSGLTYNSGTGEFSTNAIPNSQLANSSVTVGSTAIALGNSSTTLAGLSSVTSTAVITNDSGFRIRDNSDNTKQLAFECSGISGSTTRTLTVPDANGTIATQAYVNAQISAEDLDVETDSGNFDVDLNSEALTIAGGTGIDSSGSGTTATIAIDSTVTTLTGSQTLTNKTLTSPVLNSTISGTSIKDEDNMASNSASHLATQQSIKAYVDTEIAGVPQGDITAVTAGTGLSGGGTSGGVTLNIDSTVTTLTGSQTLTNKTLTSPVLNGTISGTSIKDEDNMSSNSASHIATQQSIKAYVDAEIAGVPQGDITAVTAGAGLSGGGSSGAVTLSIPNSGVSAGSYGSSSLVPTITVDARGFVTGVSTSSISTTTNLGVSTATGSVTITSSTGNNATISEATGSAAGVMSTAHHDKLDGIAAGATNVSNTNQLTNGAGFITSSSNISGNAATATALANARTIAGVSFDGTANISLNNNAITNGAGYVTSSIINSLNASNLSSGTVSDARLPGTISSNITGSSASCTGNAATATKLANARTIAGVSFDGSGNISLNNNAITNGAGYITSSSNISGNATTATRLQTARTIAGVSFNGTANISLNNNAITNGAGYVTSSVINSLNASNLSSGTIPNARFPSTLPAVDGSNLTGIAAGATGGGSDQIFYENGQTVTSNYTITNGKNAMSAGPITINSGVTVTVGSGETYTIV